MGNTQQTLPGRPGAAPHRRKSLFKLMAAAITLTMLLIGATVASAHQSTIDLPVCDGDDPTTYTATCLGENLSTVYLYFDNLRVGNVYKYRADIVNKWKIRINKPNPCEGMGFHGYQVSESYQHGWTHFRAQEVNEVRTAQISEDCTNLQRILRWKVKSVDMEAHNYTRDKHIGITPAQDGATYPWLQEQAFTENLNNGTTEFVVNLSFDPELDDDDVATTFELLLNLEDAPDCTDSVYDNLDRAITITEDDLNEPSDERLSYSVQGSIGGDDCADGTYYMEVEVWDTTGDDRTLILRTDDRMVYPAVDN